MPLPGADDCAAAGLPLPDAAEIGTGLLSGAAAEGGCLAADLMPAAHIKLSHDARRATSHATPCSSLRSTAATVDHSAGTPHLEDSCFIHQNGRPHELLASVSLPWLFTCSWRGCRGLCSCCRRLRSCCRRLRSCSGRPAPGCSPSACPCAGLCGACLPTNSRLGLHRLGGVHIFRLPGAADSCTRLLTAGTLWVCAAKQVKHDSKAPGLCQLMTRAVPRYCRQWTQIVGIHFDAIYGWTAKTRAVPAPDGR